ncbi:hypothetical protein [Nostoc sp.]|uniref:hypothetical protein n=1 Tax=Nostoc sp. TaxID=1180 RepID=UPI002FF5210F
MSQLITAVFMYLNHICCQGTALLIGVNLTGNGRLETASIQTKATDPGFHVIEHPLTHFCY